MQTPLFCEQQYMTGGWILLVVISVLLVVMLPRFRQLGVIQKVAAVVTVVLMLFTTAILLTLRLETKYYPDHIEHRFASLFGTGYDIVSMDSVISAEIRTYDPSDYGGWGAKGNDSTRACNASGNQGILLTFRSGRKLLLGTHKPGELREKLKRYYPLLKN